MFNNGRNIFENLGNNYVDYNLTQLTQRELKDVLIGLPQNVEGLQQQQQQRTLFTLEFCKHAAVAALRAGSSGHQYAILTDLTGIDKIYILQQHNPINCVLQFGL